MMLGEFKEYLCRHCDDMHLPDEIKLALYEKTVDFGDGVMVVYHDYMCGETFYIGRDVYLIDVAQQILSDLLCNTNLVVKFIVEKRDGDIRVIPGEPISQAAASLLFDSVTKDGVGNIFDKK